ncbi:hypothetical protein KDA_08570 [Dictyobacter alpinus]|uniref:NodB homology domain-containing protein n=1 Tax=Dictyobacter alpinus TaxID=2014873 RepID=A0A402B206_9CHLR|nr:polysaccharide deacetylase family protein [Dictyobacter alpinus]GCE25373.1 hypothetical protein KDA_08570 [Dictyobacter alpinus]
MMYERLRVVLAMVFFYTGITKLALRVKERSDRRLLILNYHNADGQLEKQLRYLQRHYRIMHLDEALEELFVPLSQAGTGGRDQRLPVVLTFDDGYLDNYTEGFRLAKLYHVPMTIFVIPGYIENGCYFWWLAAQKLVSQLHSEVITFAGSTYNMQSLQDRQALTIAIDAQARNATSVAEREAFLADIQLILGVALPCRDTDALDGNMPLTWEQIKEMEASGLISFGAHTVNHPILANIADPTELLFEIKESRRILEEKLGSPIRTFAYPVGKFQHIRERGVEAVRAAGYTWAVTTLEELDTSESNPLFLGRMPGDTEVHWMVMAAELVGLLGVVSRIRKKYAKLFTK